MEETAGSSMHHGDGVTQHAISLLALQGAHVGRRSNPEFAKDQLYNVQKVGGGHP